MTNTCLECKYANIEPTAEAPMICVNKDSMYYLKRVDFADTCEEFEWDEIDPAYDDFDEED